MNEFGERVIIERNKKVDNLILGEIKKIATENGVDTTITLNEKAIVSALKNWNKQNITGKWIDVNEKLPEDVYGKEREQITVLVYTKGKKVSQCSRCAKYVHDRREGKLWEKTGEFYWNKNKRVTHWMPLPAPPKEQ